MSDMEIQLLVLVSGGAFAIPFLTRLIQMPNAAGEIIYGLILGTFFGQAVPHSIHFLGELGFILLMYLAGLEIDFDRIRKTPKLEIMVYLSMFLGIGALALLTVFLLEMPVIYALVFLTTAVGLLFPVLRDCGLLNSPTGQKLLIIGTLGEIFSLLAFTAYILHSRYGMSLDSLVHVLEVIFFGVSIYISLALYRQLVWWFPELAKLIMTSENSFESSVRGNLVHMLIFVWVAYLLNLELIIGAFLGGMIFAFLFAAKHDVLNKMGSFGYGFLVPIFFISVGMKFDIQDFMAWPVFQTAVILSGLIFVIRILTSPILLLVGFSTREVVATGLALTFPLTLLVAIAAFGNEMALLEKDQTAAILLTAILTSIGYPILFKKVVSVGKVENRLSQSELSPATK